MCYKEEGSGMKWSVALGASCGEREVWAVQVGGRTGRMAVGVALDTEEVLAAQGGWTSPECAGKVWYYTSTGAVRAGPISIADTGLKFGEGDVIMLDVDAGSGQLHIARGTCRAETGRVGFSARHQPVTAKRTRPAASGYVFECLPAVDLAGRGHGAQVDAGMESGEAVDAEGEASSCRQAVKLCVAVTMLLEGACCELLRLRPSEGVTLPDHTCAVSASEESRGNWADRLWPLMPPLTLAPTSLGALTPAAGGPPSVPRLSLTGVGDAGAGPWLHRGGAGSGNGPGSGGREGPISGGRDCSGSDGNLPSPDPTGPLSSRSGGTIASNSPGRNMPAILGDGRGALALGGPRPSPRLAGGGLGTSRTPRGYSVTSPQITPRTASATAFVQLAPPSPTRRASPRIEGAGSPRRGLANVSPRVCDRSTFVSPRVPSPRTTTPRGALTASPRKPLDALPATLTLQQHQKMESMLNRIDTLEGMVMRTLSENRRLQTELVAVKRRAANTDVMEAGGFAARHPVSTVTETNRTHKPIPLQSERVHAPSPGLSGNGAAAAAGTHDARLGVNEGAGPVTRLASASSSLLLCDEASGGKGARPDAAGKEADGLASQACGEGPRAASCAGARGSTLAGAGAQPRAFQLSDVWEVRPAEVRRVRCIGRGACGTVWEGEWRRARVAVKDLELAVCAGGAGGAEAGDGAGSAGGGGGRSGMDHDKDKEMLTAFRGEVSQLTSLRHPNILAFYGAVTSGEKLSMIVELMDKDVRSYLRDEARGAALEARLRVGVGALSGIMYLHSLTPPVVHRDIKPENLLLSHGNSVVKICDLGLARHKHGAFLQTAHQGGTLSYIAPEVHRGANIDESCDIYAMAIVVWELVTRETPFADKPPQSIPGIVGWGAERPTLAAVTACDKAELDSAAAAAGECDETSARKSLAVWLQECWAQDPQQRPRASFAQQTLLDVTFSLTGPPPHRAQATAAGGGEMATRQTPARGRSKGRASRPHSPARPPSPRARESGDI